MIKDPSELIDISKKIEEINKEFEEEDSIFKNKYFIYPTGSISVIIIVSLITGVVVYIYVKGKKIKYNKPLLYCIL